MGPQLLLCALNYFATLSDSLSRIYFLHLETNPGSGPEGDAKQDLYAACIIPWSGSVRHNVCLTRDFPPQMRTADITHISAMIR